MASQQKLSLTRPQMEIKLDECVEELKKQFGSFRAYLMDWKFVVRRAWAPAGVLRPDPYKPIEVFFSETAMCDYDKKTIKGVILHEILHIYNQHFARADKMIKDVIIKLPKEEGFQPSLWNVATDLAINYSIENYFKPFNVNLPEGGLFTHQFPQKIREKIEDVPAEVIFDVLKNEYEKDTENFVKALERAIKEAIKKGMKQQGQGGQGGQQGQPQQGQGQGDGRGQQQEDGYEPGYGKPAGMTINVNFDDHSGLEKSKLNPEEANKADKTVRGDSKKKDEGDIFSSGQIGESWNHSAGDPFQYQIQKFAIQYYTSIRIGRLLKAIRSEATKNASSLTPSIKYSYQKHSRRKYLIAQRYGSVYKGKGKQMKQKDLIVALDTSGSISESDIRTAIEIINGFMVDWKFNIYLIQCDNAIRETKYYTHKIKEIDAKGRGGTNYQPVFNYIKKCFIDKGEDPQRVMCVYIGDGQTSHQIESYGINTIWLLNQNYDKRFYDEVKFGKKFIIPTIVSGS